MISVTLDGNSEAVSLTCSGGWVDLCGINDQSNAETIDAWGNAISNFTPSCLVRFERGGFSLGTTRGSLLGYYEDVLSMMNRYSFDWYSNDYYDILSGGGLADANTVEYGAYRNFNMELLELLQKHQ